MASELERYLRAFGRLTVNFATLEAALRLLVGALPFPDQRISLTMLAGKRANLLVDDLKRLAPCLDSVATTTIMERLDMLVPEFGL